MKNDNFKKDAGENSIYLNEQFNEIETEMIKNEKGQPLFRKILGIQKTKHSFSESYTYRFSEGRGIAQILRGDTDKTPRFTEVGEQATVYIKDIGGDLGVSHTELAAAQANQQDLPAMRLVNAKGQIEAGLDKLVALGDGANKGLLNTSGIGIDDLSIAGTHDGWVANDRTALECVETIQSAITAVQEATNYVENPNVLILPIPAFTYLLNITSGEGSLATTGMQMLQRRFPDLLIEKWQYCNTAGASSTRAVVFDNKMDSVHMLMAQEINRGEFIADGTKGYVAKCNARSAGCIILKKAAVRYIDDL